MTRCEKSRQAVRDWHYCRLRVRDSRLRQRKCRDVSRCWERQIQRCAPLAGGTVSFRSSDNSTHLTARGEINDNGEFTLTTFEPGDGAVTGRHQAIVTPPIQRAPRGGGWEAPPTMPKINRRFSSFDTSGLEFDVSDNVASNRFDIVVTKPDR